MLFLPSSHLPPGYVTNAYLVLHSAGAKQEKNRFSGGLQKLIVKGTLLIVKQNLSLSVFTLLHLSGGLDPNDHNTPVLCSEIPTTPLSLTPHTPCSGPLLLLISLQRMNSGVCRLGPDTSRPLLCLPLFNPSAQSPRRLPRPPTAPASSWTHEPWRVYLGNLTMESRPCSHFHHTAEFVVLIHCTSQGLLVTRLTNPL